MVATLVAVFAACSACSTPKTVPAAPSAPAAIAEVAPAPAAPVQDTADSDVAELNRTLAKVQMDEIERWANEPGLDEATRTTRVECLKAARVFNEARLPWWRESKNGERVWVVQDKLTQYALEWNGLAVNLTRWSRTEENGQLSPRSTGMRDWTLEPYRDLHDAATAVVKWIQASDAKK
jgi:hypothetical protein